MIDIHVTHCCINCGCKYGDDHCSVVSGKTKQKYICYDCNHNPSDNKATLPEEGRSVLAEIESINCNGKSNWYEVVYILNNEWHSYFGSETFEDGEHVIKWKYTEDCF